MGVVGTRKVIRLTVNNKEYKVEVGANETLLDVLREKLCLT
ncbi:MAG: (2Fe-2S)-binding protein, partial [Deltaproteobacteria bacterium]|nr:(2Fe-2S)-binding protein [Deltaproteobacteria bacterium]